MDYGEVGSQLLSGSIVTGLGFLAYHHPSRYQTLAPYLASVCALVGVGMFVWLLAVQQAEIAVIELVKYKNLDLLHKATAAIKPSYWTCAGIAIIGPFLFMLVLPWIGTLKHPEDKAPN